MGDDERFETIRRLMLELGSVKRERDLAREQLADALVIIKALLDALPDEVADVAILEMPESISEMLEF